MRIMGSRSANLYKRSLATRQIEARADLCEVMEEFSTLKANHVESKEEWITNYTINLLNLSDEELKKRNTSKAELVKKLSDDEFKKINPSNMSREEFIKALSHKDFKLEEQPNVFDSLIKKYIPLAAEGNFSFLTDPDFIGKETERLSVEETNHLSECFRKYGKFSSILSNFRNAEAAFTNCITKTKKGEIVIKNKELKAYQKAVKAGDFSGAVSEFDSHFEKHSRTYIGHEDYVIYSKSLTRIALTQPELLKGDSFKKITPGIYDANIKGFYRPKDIKKTYDALSKYVDTVPGSLKESLYTHTLGTRFTGESIKKLLTRGLVVLTLVGVLAQGAQQNQISNSITAQNAEKQGYHLFISNETEDQLKLAMEKLETMKQTIGFPSVEELKGLNTLIDNNMNLIIGDLATRAVEDAKPEWKVNKVKTGYNDYAAKDGDPSNSVTIEYVDEKGNTQTTVVTNFSNPNLLLGITQAIDGKNTTLEETFDSERAYDREFLDLLEVYSKATTNDEKNEALNAIYQYFDTHIEAQNIVGGKAMVFKDGLFSDKLYLNLSNKNEIQAAGNSGKTTTSTVKDNSGREFDD